MENSSTVTIMHAIIKRELSMFVVAVECTELFEMWKHISEALIYT